jgi:hypothetical protein
MPNMTKARGKAELMSPCVKLVGEHGVHVAPLLATPTTEAEYDRLVEQRDEILAALNAHKNR